MKILGYNYTVDRSKSQDEVGAMGRFHAKSQAIQIANDINQQQDESTMIHEAIEAINYHLGLELEHKDITALEAALYQVLTDNGVDLAPLMDLI